MAAILVMAAPATGQNAGVLQRYALDRGDGQAVNLPRQLAEASGLAVSADGRVFAHNDEHAVVFEIDPGTGNVVRSFSLGEEPLRGDFEGIAVAGSRMFLVTSDGTLYEFASAADGAAAPYSTHQGLHDRNCEVEGLEYDRDANALLLACKAVRGRALDGRLVVFSFRLDGMRAEPVPHLSVPLEFLRSAGLRRALSPSGIALHPVAHTLFVVAAREKLLVELDRTGTPLAVHRLAGRAHRQPEGIAFAADGTLLIADEARGGRATLTRYSYAAETRP